MLNLTRPRLRDHFERAGGTLRARVMCDHKEVFRLLETCSGIITAMMTACTGPSHTQQAKTRTELGKWTGDPSLSQGAIGS